MTERVFAAYASSETAGRAAYRRAADASGVEPPGLVEFAWSPVMGTAEVQAYLGAADRLEQAVESGELRPGGRGWRAAQQRIVAAHLDTVDPLSGQAPRLLVLTERVGRWADRGGPTGRRLRAAVANRLLAPVPLPADAEAGLAPLRWLLEHTPRGLPLTQVGNVPRPLVLDAVDRFGWWHFPGRPGGSTTWSSCGRCASRPSGSGRSTAAAAGWNSPAMGGRCSLTRRRGGEPSLPA